MSQLCFTPGGGASIVHTVRIMCEAHPDWPCVSMDLKNAHNEIRRRKALKHPPTYSTWHYTWGRTSSPTTGSRPQENSGGKQGMDTHREILKLVLPLLYQSNQLWRTCTGRWEEWHYLAMMKGL